MKARKLLCSLLCCLLLLGLAPTAGAAGLRADIAAGPVILNNYAIDNTTAEYPLLVYKNITYFPMTYHLCRFLGLTTKWDSATKTFAITKTGGMGEYVPDTGHSRKSGSVSVTKVNYPVVVNGTPVDNAAAEWPLLNYNNITYFPLTWAFAVEEFGWEYHWNAEDGLQIASAVDASTLWEEKNDASRRWGDLALQNPDVIELDLDGDWTYAGLEKAIGAYLEAYYKARSDQWSAMMVGRLAKVEIGLGFTFPEAPKAGDVLTVPYTATYNGDSVVLSSGETFLPTSAAENRTAKVRLTGEGVTGDAARPGADLYGRLEACAQLTGLTGTDANTAIFNAVAANLDSAGLAGQYVIQALVTGERSGQAVAFQVTFAPIQGGEEITISGQAAFAAQ